MNVSLTKLALLAAIYFLYKNSLEMDKMRTKLRAAGIQHNDTTVA